MSCEDVKHPILPMIDALCEKLGGWNNLDEEYRRLRRATEGHITIGEATLLLYRELVEAVK